MISHNDNDKDKNGGAVLVDDNLSQSSVSLGSHDGDQGGMNFLMLDSNASRGRGQTQLLPATY